MNKKAQAALWVIIALLILAILLIVLLIPRGPVSPTPTESNFQSKIELCVKDNVEEAIDIMLPQGGFIEPENYRIYNNIKVAYLCQNIAYYKPCVNQHPVYITEIKKEIYDYILPKITNCFDTAIKDLQDKGYLVTAKDLNLSVELSSDLVLIEIDKEVFIQKDEQSQKFENFEIRLGNPLYDLAKVANEIANQEAKFCYFEYVGYMILNPRFSIEKFAMSDSTKIYTISDTESNKELNIAIRSCVIPPGI